MTNARSAAQAAWLTQRVDRWREIERQARTLERGSGHDPDPVIDLLRAYRELAGDLAIARRVLPDGPTRAYLEALYGRVHRVTRAREPVSRHALVTLYRDAVPAAVLALRAELVLVTALFIAAGVAGWFLVMAWPELAALFLSERMLINVEQGELWTDDLLNVAPSSLLSAQIFANNIAVTLFALCLGVFFGIGTFYVIVLNGVMLGGVFAMTAQHGLAGRLFDFVAAHGPVELSVICIAGAAGAAIGGALARPAAAGRRRMFQQATMRAATLAALLIPLLVLAGLIEGYISPDPAHGRGLRLAVGLGSWLLMCWALAGFRVYAAPRSRSPA